MVPSNKEQKKREQYSQREAIAIRSCSFFFFTAWLAISLFDAKMIPLPAPPQLPEG